MKRVIRRLIHRRVSSLPQYPEIFDHAYMGITDVPTTTHDGECQLPHPHDFKGYFLDTELNSLVYTAPPQITTTITTTGENDIFYVVSKLPRIN